NLQAAVQGFCGLELVQCMKFRSKACNGLGFIALQVSNNSPFQIRQFFAQGFVLAFGLLHLVLAQQATTGLVSQADAVNSEGFADGEQTYIASGTPVAHAGGINSLLYQGNAFPKCLYTGGGGIMLGVK